MPILNEPFQLNSDVKFYEERREGYVAMQNNWSFCVVRYMCGYAWELVVLEFRLL